jgi:hypothetical protein
VTLAAIGYAGSPESRPPLARTGYINSIGRPPIITKSLKHNDPPFWETIRKSIHSHPFSHLDTHLSPSGHPSIPICQPSADHLATHLDTHLDIRLSPIYPRLAPQLQGIPSVSTIPDCLPSVPQSPPSNTRLNTSHDSITLCFARLDQSVTLFALGKARQMRKPEFR